MLKENIKFEKNYDNWVKCRTRKCSKDIKKRDTESKRFHKTLKCPDKPLRAYARCLDKSFQGSKLQQLTQEVRKCSEKKCHKQWMKVRHRV